MRSESAPTRINPELGSKASNVTFVDFKAMLVRSNMMAITGLVADPEIGSLLFKPLGQKISEGSLIQLTGKETVYNPNRRSKQLVDQANRRERRQRRGSRCFQPGHEPKSCHRGESGCGIRNKRTFLSQPKKEKASKAPKKPRLMRIKEPLRISKIS